jgi:hypothetical protein
MRYLVTGRVKAGRAAALLEAIESGTLGAGSIAEGEYLRNMNQARLVAGETVRWVEVCFCWTPLAEEQPYWEEYFELVQIKAAHAQDRCRDENGTEPWACSTCDCTSRLETAMENWGDHFLTRLRERKGQEPGHA